jgi:hypothetical protein
MGLAYQCSLRMLLDSEQPINGWAGRGP